MNNFKKILFLIFGTIFIMGAVGALWLFKNQESFAKGIPVLNYHGVEDGGNSPLHLSRKEFEEQMEYLYRKGYHTISPDQLIDHLQQGSPLPDKPILITFDDGYQNIYTNVFPIMRKYGFTGTVFLITDEVGVNKRYLTWEQAEAMRKPGGSIEGGFIFGSHTLSHVPLDTLSPEEAFFQLEKSKEGMQWKLDVPVKYFAYPTGTYSEVTQQMVAKAGYKGAFSIQFGRVGPDSNVYALERIPIFKSYWSFYDFYLRLEFTSLIQKMKMVKEVL